MRSSVSALLRLNPKVVFVASSTGYDLIRHDLLPNLSWTDFELSEAPVRSGSRPELLKLGRHAGRLEPARQFWPKLGDYPFL